MNMLILTPEKQVELAALNASENPSRVLTALPLTNGAAALGADLLGDSGPGQTWEHYGAFLETLPQAEVSPEEIAEPQMQ